MTSGFCTGCTIKSELTLPLGQKAMGPGIYNLSGALEIGASFNSTVLICLFWKKKKKSIAFNRTNILGLEYVIK